MLPHDHKNHTGSYFDSHVETTEGDKKVLKKQKETCNVGPQLVLRMDSENLYVLEL